RSIHNRKNITIVTNTVNVPMELSKRNDLTVIVTGGTLRGNWFSLIGMPAIRTIEGIIADKAFIGVDGIHADYGFTSHYPDEAAFYAVSVAHARQRIVVAHHEKIGKVAQAIICSARDVELLITDVGATDESVAPFIDLGIQVMRV